MLNPEALQSFADVNNLNQNNQMPHDMIENILHNDIAIDSTSQAMTETLNQAMLDEFKSHVKEWLEVDNHVKRFKAAIKGLLIKKKNKNDIILDFMRQYNIEDLNTKEGIIRYRKTYVKEPLSQKTIKSKLEELLIDDRDILDKVQMIFTDRVKIEKTSLRRLKI